MKTIAVIGLGKFGFYIAKSMCKLNVQVIAVDNDEKKVQGISEYVDNAFVIDSTSKQALEEVGIYNLNTVIVSIGENIEASILTVMALKDLNNKRIIAKAITNTHGEILAKIGAFKVVYPEKIAGRMLVKKFVDDIPVEEIDISDSIKGVKLVVGDNLVGKTVSTIENEYYNFKIVAYKSKDKWFFCVNEGYQVQSDDQLILLGETKYIDGLYQEI